MGGPDILHAVNRAIDVKKRSLSGRFVTRYCVPSSSGGLAAAAALNSKWEAWRRLTMRLSDAGLHQRQTKALCPDHRLPPWLTEDARRDRSNRLLGLYPRTRVPTPP